MNLTIAELASAVDKSEAFVRQHVHRRHLATQKTGRSVYVPLHEAVRWARERGLAFELPSVASLPIEGTKERVARMTVLVTFQPSGPCLNILTLVRHRSPTTVGPWAREPVGNWSRDDLEEGFSLFSIDTSLQQCQAMINQILESGKLEVDGLQVFFELHANPRNHRAYRDHRLLSDSPMLSPFSKHSAEVIEYWSFAAEPRKQWLAVLAKHRPNAPEKLAKLGFRLDRYPDRAGNLLVAGAEDSISCDLKAHHDQTLRLQVDTNELLPGYYRAAVWATHSGDAVLRREISVDTRHTTIDLPSDVDHIGFAIHRATDGECIDSMEAYLLKEVKGLMEVSGVPTLHLHDPRRRTVHKVTPSGPVSTINVAFNDDHDDLDRNIRLQWLDRQVYEREAAARREGNFVRFGPGHFADAATHFIGIMRRHSDRPETIYVADPYFLDKHAIDDGRTRQLYFDFLAATHGRLVRILCAQKFSKAAKLWWSQLPTILTSHATIRTFLRRESGENTESQPPAGDGVSKTHRKSQAGFHDRYLITPNRETLITNSFNGWTKHGVTFSTHIYGVYGAEAEKLWAMEVDSQETILCVEELAR